MGIYSLKTLLNKYISEYFVPTKIKSEVCYIDFTNKICISTERIASMYKANKDLYSNPITIVKEIIAKDVELLFNQIKMNKFFKKFVVAFDYGILPDTWTYKDIFDKELIDKYVSSFNKYSKIKTIVLIPRNMVEHINDPRYTQTILSASKLLCDTRCNVRSKSRTADLEKYISLDYLKDKIDPEIYDLFKYSGLTQYMLTRGCKEATRLKRQEKDKILWKDLDPEDFDEMFKTTIMTITPRMLINMVPQIVNELMERFDGKYKVEFIGAHTESDFSILKHIDMYHQNHCPTIYTNDTDFFTLLSDRDVIIKFPYQNEKTGEKYNVSIRPKDFWNWLLNDRSWNYHDIVTLSCLLGTDYNRDSPYHIRTLDKVRKFFKDNKENIKGDPKRMFDKIYDFALNSLNYSNRHLSFLFAMNIYSKANAIENQVLYVEPVPFGIENVEALYKSIYLRVTLGKDNVDEPIKNNN